MTIRRDQWIGALRLARGLEQATDGTPALATARALRRMLEGVEVTDVNANAIEADTG